MVNRRERRPKVTSCKFSMQDPIKSISMCERIRKLVRAFKNQIEETKSRSTNLKIKSPTNGTKRRHVRQIWNHKDRLTLECLKGLDTFGNCQRPVFSLGAYHYMHKITNLWKFELNWSSKLRGNNGRKNTLVKRSCVLSDARFRDLKV